MAIQTISRSILRRPAKSFSLLFTRSFSSSSPLANSPVVSRSAANSPAVSRSASTLLNRSRPLVAGFSTVVRAGLFSARDLSTQATSSSLNDPNPNWSNRPPKETILLDGCDFEHWLVVMEQPEGDLTRDQIIDYYIKTLAQVVGSEEEARMKIYSVSHRCYFAFGALVSEDLSHKIKELPKVKWVLPDSYLDVKNKDYGGEPFIDGKAVPYDPKYHEEWIRNNARAADRNRRNDRPRNSDRSRNFERRRENVGGNQDSGYRGPPPNQGMGGAAPPNMNQTYRGPPPPPNMGQNYQGTPPPPNINQNYQGSPPPPNMNQNYQGPPPSNMGQNYRGPPPPPPSMSQNYQGPPPPNVNGGWSGNYQQNGGYQQGQHGGMQQQPYPPSRDQYKG